MPGWRHAGDRRIVVAWLKANTRDEPGLSHVDVFTIVKGTGLTEHHPYNSDGVGQFETHGSKLGA